jgi:iron complex outermembrane receptor protein
LRASFDLSPQHDLDVMVRHIGVACRIPRCRRTRPWTRAWDGASRRDFDVSLTFQNLFDPSHPEFGRAATRSEYERAFFLKLQWRL